MDTSVTFPMEMRLGQSSPGADRNTSTTTSRRPGLLFFWERALIILHIILKITVEIEPKD
jgi:hypothetical protein